MTEDPTAIDTRLLTGVFEAIITGFEEQGIPLTAEQRDWLMAGADRSHPELTH